jgi:uncharacterized protein
VALTPPDAHSLAGTVRLWRRVARHPVTRMLAAAMAMFLLLALSYGLSEALVPKDRQSGWPQLAGAFACALGYWIHVRAVERRAVSELNAAAAIPEWCTGTALGALIGLLVMAPLWGLGMYTTNGFGDTAPLLRQLPDMVLVSVMEELLIRGVVFRIAEAAWGRRRALVVSTLLFVAAHLPGDINVIGVLVTAAASLAFSAAFVVTGRLWLPMGMHFAWNYLFAAVLSVPVSGHEAKGWIHGSMNGPEWLTGGSYGVEASVAALLAWSLAAALLLRRAPAIARQTPQPA